MAKSTETNEAGDAISPTVSPTVSVNTPQQGAKEEVRYMPPGDSCARKGTHLLPSGNKVTNA